MAGTIAAVANNGKGKKYMDLAGFFLDPPLARVYKTKRPEYPLKCVSLSPGFSPKFNV